VWQRGHEVCPANRDRPCWEHEHLCGLKNFVQADGIREDWVIIAIAWQRARQIEGTPEQQAKASRVLSVVAKMLYQVGSGDRSERTKAERDADKKRRDQRAGAWRKLKRRYDTWLPRYGGNKVDAFREATSETLTPDDVLEQLTTV
jgi:hypothetical protein